MYNKKHGIYLEEESFEAEPVERLACGHRFINF